MFHVRFHSPPLSSPPPPPTSSSQPSSQPPTLPPATASGFSSGLVAAIVIGSLAVAASAAVLVLLLFQRLSGSFGRQALATGQGWPMNLSVGYQSVGPSGSPSEETEALRPGGLQPASGGHQLQGPKAVDSAAAAVTVPGHAQSLQLAGIGAGAHHVAMQYALPEIDASDFAQAREISGSSQSIPR